MRRLVNLPQKPDYPTLQALLARIREEAPTTRILGLQGAAAAFLLSLVSRRTQRPLIVVSPSEAEARNHYRNFTFFLGEEAVLNFPPWEIHTSDLFAVQRDVELRRIESLARLSEGRVSVVVMPLQALIQKVIPRPVFDQYVQKIAIGDFLDRETLARKLTSGGYTTVTLVEARGEFSTRGHIIDLFPPHLPRPIRMEFMGDELESIREFEPQTQRSASERVDFQLVPARELILSPERTHGALRNIRQRALELDLSKTLRDRLTDILDTGLAGSINPLFLPLFYGVLDTGGASPGPLGTCFDYLPPDGILVLDNEPLIQQARQDAENAFDRLLFKARSEDRLHLQRETFCLDREGLDQGLDTCQRLYLDELTSRTGGDGGEEPPIRFEVHPLAGLKEGPDGVSPEGLLGPLARQIQTWMAGGNLVLFLCAGPEERARTLQILQGYQLYPQQTVDPLLGLLEKMAPQGMLLLREGKISGGFSMPEFRVALISEEDVFGRKTSRRRVRTVREGYFLKSFGELKEGDFVVHQDHGIGQYRGLQKLTVAGIVNDFLVMEYQEDGRLYLPVDRFDQIQRYIGPEGYAPKVDRLGGTSWEAVKERVKRSIREVAEELVSIYAAREIMDREAFSPPDRLYEEFAATFEYEETPDQAKAIDDIHYDMNSPKPMDRLICGDAGFGKTEVALRASFRAVMDGRQVAVLVPTTVLAEQHFQTFTRRIGNYPLRVAVLDRLKTKAEQQQVVQEIQRGTVDIVIGTHRLLQKDVAFKNLGLVIIDEEQRFGVAHKEKLKKLRTLVDILTLTATPIPRTLHLSLVGIRDLSIINTPPEDRLPIKTYVSEFDEDTIRDAIRQELARGGQVFFLHDRVRSIFSIARLVERLVPEAHVGVVHGRMGPKEIEQAMIRFVRQSDNVLVCTTIIGSGVDIPSANTIIINRADRFGLAQLYQLRGRVGRSREEAFAYLLVPKGVLLSRDAQKRLQVLLDLSEPGSGFKIASHDLEIRGAGNMLGLSQSGHVSAVGYELYTELMESTIRELKGEPPPQEEYRPEINLGLSAFIPEDYMADEHRRLVTYKRISLADSEEDLQSIRDEMQDCFGYIPPEMDHLLETIRIRNLLKDLRGQKMGYDGKQFALLLQETSPIDPARIVFLARRVFRGMTLAPDGRLSVPAPGLAGSEILRQAKQLPLALGEAGAR